MKTKVKYILICLIALGFAACDDDDKYKPGYKEFLNINSFAIDGIEGEINHEEAIITLIMPMGTELTNLIPDISLESGATVTPSSGEAQNFLTEKRYTVVNQGMYRVYKVNVKEMRLGITSFMIGNHKGVIDDYNQTIKVYMPQGSDVTSLSPAVQYTEGATISPENSSVIDFTGPVNYTVEKSGYKIEYKVSIVFGESPLIIYNGEDIAPVWTIIGNGDISSAWDNPSPGSLNRTEKCATTWRNPGDDPWQGGGLWGLNINPSVYKIFSVLVLKEYAGDVQMEIQGLNENGEGMPNQYLKQMYSADALGKWQHLTFKLPSDHGFTKIHGILVAPHSEDTKNNPDFFGHRVYWDQLIAYEKE